MRKANGWKARGSARSTRIFDLGRSGGLYLTISRERSYNLWYWLARVRDFGGNTVEERRGRCEPDIDATYDKAKGDAREAAERAGRELAEKHKLEVEW